MTLLADNAVSTSQVNSPNAFYIACLNGNLEEAKSTFSFEYRNASDENGNTPLHVASIHGHEIIIRLLFRYNADVNRQNKENKTPREVAKNDEIKQIFQTSSPNIENAKKFISPEDDLEWIDSYKNAHRISYENRDHLQRWVLKIPLHKLLDELQTGYVDKMEFTTTVCGKLNDYMNFAKRRKHLIPLLLMYTDPLGFYARLNRDLAEIGSSFRFWGTQVLFNSGFMDNEPPQGLGQYIYTAILMNHPAFDQYYKITDKKTTYRGMNISDDDFKQYKKGDYVLTRSFLSSSVDEKVSEMFRATQTVDCLRLNEQNKLSVVCEYTICNPRSALDLSQTANEGEKEVLIVPFIVFEITDIIPASNTQNEYVPARIKLTERDTAP